MLQLVVSLFTGGWSLFLAHAEQDSTSYARYRVQDLLIQKDRVVHVDPLQEYKRPCVGFAAVSPSEPSHPAATLRCAELTTLEGGFVSLLLVLLFSYLL